MVASIMPPLRNSIFKRAFFVGSRMSRPPPLVRDNDENMNPNSSYFELLPPSKQLENDHLNCVKKKHFEKSHPYQSINN